MKQAALIFPLLMAFLAQSALSASHKTDIKEPFVKENTFITQTPDFSAPPKLEDVQDKLPVPHWPARPDAVAGYWKAWEIAFSNLHAITRESKFVSPYIEAALINGDIFMWDTAFVAMYGKYGYRAFDFQASLDNFYAKQHPDGFICRKINPVTGEDDFEKQDVSSTGPNIMPWAEWEYYLDFNDKERLRKVFPPLVAYYKWLRLNRTWKDGSYFLSGWGCGMDNQPRLQQKPGYHDAFSHGHMSWIDASLQQIMAGKILLQMAKELGREGDIKDIREDVDYLKKFINDEMWNKDTQFYSDKFRDGTVSKVQSVGAYWALLADAVPQERFKPFLAHLEDPAKFNRPHRVPTLAADDPGYSKDGGYWKGAVWAPTTYMVLRGLTETKQDKLAHDIALNHFNSVTKVFTDTGTFFENYAPEKIEGRSRKNHVGWTGLPPIAVLFEYVFGLRPDVPQNKLVWDIRMTDEFGVSQYPFGGKGLIDLKCEKRDKLTDPPNVSISSTVDLDVTLLWEGGKREMNVKASK